MFACQISQINNGWLLMLPSKQNPITSEVTPPTTEFFQDIPSLIHELGDIMKFVARDDSNQTSLFTPGN